MFLATGQHAPRGGRLFLLFAALVVLAAAPAFVCRAQAIGAHRGEIGGSSGSSGGGNRAIQGRIISPLGQLSEARVRVTLESTNAGLRTATTDADGSFIFNNLEAGPYQITIDAGKEYEVARETVYIEGPKPIYNVHVYLRAKPGVHPAFAGVPTAAVDLYLKAAEALRKNDGKKAIEHLNAAVIVHPQFALALNELGVQYLKAGQLDKAAETLRAALKLTPDDFTPLLNYGIVLTQKKQFAEAEEQLRRAAGRNNKSATARLYLGIALVGQSKLDEAETELQQAVKLSGDSMAQAHRYLGGIYWGKKDYQRAADHLEAYLKLNPKADDAERTRAAIKDLRGKQK